MAPALLALRETSSSSAVIPFQRIALAWNVEVASCSHPRRRPRPVPTGRQNPMTKLSVTGH
jgi:hypothetical protein